MRSLFYYVFIVIFIVVSFSYGEDEKYFYKEYPSYIMSGGREIFIFNNNEDKKNINISLIKVDVDLFYTYSKVTINYMIKNKSKNSVECKFLYPFLYSDISKKIEKTEEAKFIENRTEDIIKKGIYLDFKIVENGINKEYEVEFSDIAELNIPYKIGDEKKIFTSKSLYSEKVISFSHKYGFFKTVVNFKGKERKIINITYLVPNYNNTIKSNFSYDNSIEDPSLRYMFKKINDNFEMLSDYLFYFVLYPKYIDDLIIPKKFFIRIKPYIINNKHLKIFPNKYSIKSENIIFSYSLPKFKEYDNIILSILPLNSKNSISSFYFISTPEKIKRDKVDFYSLKKGEDLIFEYIDDNNLSFLIKKESDKIGITEIRVLPAIFTLKKSIKDTNLPLEFEIIFSDNRDFSPSISVTKKFSYKDFYTLLTKRKYLTIFKESERIFTKFIKIRVTKSFFEDNDIIQINDIEFIN